MRTIPNENQGHKEAEKISDHKSFIEAMVTAADARDPYSSGHSRRVRKYALLAAGVLGLPPEELQVIEFGALLHDIGKIGILDSILRKPGPLTAEEWYIIRKHAAKGADIVGEIPSLEKARDLVLYHHERFDGKGYPKGLKGGEIPIGAYLIAVADAFDAMTVDQSYRAAQSLEEAMSELINGAGKQFHPTAVDAFISGIQKQKGKVIIDRPMQAVVVPLDGSKLAEVALPYAEEVAGKMGAKMVLLSVLDSPAVCEYQKNLTYTRQILAVTKENANKYVGELSCRTVKVETAIQVGRPADAITDYASKHECCLIVMATHGRSGISRWAVGSVADNVARANSRQPVMLIRAKYDRPEVKAKRIFKKALVPLDGSEASRAILPLIIEMAAKLEMRLTLLQVVPKDHHHGKETEAYLRGECARLEAEGIGADYQLGIGTPAHVIIRLSDEGAYDLVAMSTHGRSCFTLWGMGSVAQKVLLSGTTPLLLAKQ